MRPDAVKLTCVADENTSPPWSRAGHTALAVSRTYQIQGRVVERLRSYRTRFRIDCMERLPLLGAAGGAMFAVVAIVAYAIAPGPSSGYGPTVVEYYTAHGTAALWQSVLVGVAVVLFLWFAVTFAAQLSAGPLSIVFASVTAGLLMVTVGATESLGEVYRHVSFVDASSEDYAAAHAIYDVGDGAEHLALFTVAAYVAVTAVALLASNLPLRRLGWIGIALAAVQLLNALYQIFSTSHRSVVVNGVVVIAFILWVFVLSIVLVVSLRGDAAAAPAAARRVTDG
jgi:uncharacterized membrane protein